jgi:hypothetical protein
MHAAPTYIDVDLQTKGAAIFLTRPHAQLRFSASGRIKWGLEIILYSMSSNSLYEDFDHVLFSIPSDLD